MYCNFTFIVTYNNNNVVLRNVFALSVHLQPSVDASTTSYHKEKQGIERKEDKKIAYPRANSFLF